MKKIIFSLMIVGLTFGGNVMGSDSLTGVFSCKKDKDETNPNTYAYQVELSTTAPLHHLTGEFHMAYNHASIACKHNWGFINKSGVPCVGILDHSLDNTPVQYVKLLVEKIDGNLQVRFDHPHLKANRVDQSEEDLKTDEVILLCDKIKENE